MKPCGVALIGCGTVGTGVARLLLDQAERLQKRAGRPLVLRRVVVQNPDKPRDIALPPEMYTRDLRQVIEDPEVEIAVEVVGGTGWARHAVLDLLAAGKHIVTANKALLATHGPEIFDAGRQYGRAIAFEASVAGGVPIITALSQSMTANQIVSLQAILNGTSNFILTRMTEQGASYHEALAEAQRLGYAEADPTLDVDGTDAAHKLAILAQIAFGLSGPVGLIPQRGIEHLQQADIRFAHELGYTIKLLAEAHMHPNGLALHVAPVMLRHLAPLALVREAFNAIFLVGDVVGNTLYYGPGAGQMPTASAVVGDIIDVAVGRAQQTFDTLRLWSGGHVEVPLRDANEVVSRFYVRLMVEDRPGVLAEIAHIFARHEISINSIIQHEALEGQESLPLVIMTHEAPTGQFMAAIEELNLLKTITAPCVYFPVGD